MEMSFRFAKQLIRSFAMSENATEKKKLCILVKILLGCTLAIVGLFFLANAVNDVIANICSTLAQILIISLPFLSITALIKIGFSGNELKGVTPAIVILVFASSITYDTAYYEVPRAKQGHAPLVCATNLKGLSNALNVYAFEYGDMLPNENWCDVLIEKVDVGPKSLLCRTSDSVRGESDYCLNKNAAGKKLSELPEDLVLMFEATFAPSEYEIRVPIANRKSFNKLNIDYQYFEGDEKVYLNRWNRTGGPEQLAANRHIVGCNVMFADGSVKPVKDSKLHQLRWNIEGTSYTPESFPVQISSAPSNPIFKVVSFTLVGITCLLFSAFVIIRYKNIKWRFVVILALLSTGTGWFFGVASNFAYNAAETQIGAMLGAIFGLLVGIWFAVIMPKFLSKITNQKGELIFSSSAGMLTGIACSTLVHVSLIIAYQEKNLFGIIVGIPFGILAGAILGTISFLIFSRLYKVERNEVSANEAI